MTPRILHVCRVCQYSEPIVTPEGVPIGAVLTFECTGCGGMTNHDPLIVDGEQRRVYLVPEYATSRSTPDA